MTTRQLTSVYVGKRRWAAPAEARSSGWAARVRADVGTLPVHRLRRVIQYIHENLGKNLSLAELAAVIHMSPYHFARLFKYTTGVPPHRFVVQQRLTCARGVLTKQELSIAQISKMVGFRTQSHFTTVFRHALGTTPGAYRTAYLRQDRSEGEGGGDGIH